LQDIDTTAIEAKEIRVAECCQHGDLHCANVVFNNAGRAMLIDFGDTGASFAAIDPVTMELSTVFHSQAATLPKTWPLADTLGKWPMIDDYLSACPYGEFIRACRIWAANVAGSPEEVIAVAYAYAMRQFKYEDTNKNHARSLIRACIAALR
jgi:thiamine kinase-like enzyme